MVWIPHQVRNDSLTSFFSTKHFRITKIPAVVVIVEPLNAASTPPANRNYILVKKAFVVKTTINSNAVVFYPGTEYKLPPASNLYSCF